MFTSLGFAMHGLPPEVPFSPPPAVTCYVRSSSTANVWLQMADGLSTVASNAISCGVQRSATTGAVSATLLMPTSFAGWEYAIVVVY